MYMNNLELQEDMVNHRMADIPHIEGLEMALSLVEAAVAAFLVAVVAEDFPVVDPEDTALRMDPQEEVHREDRLLPDHQMTPAIRKGIGEVNFMDKGAVSHNIPGHGTARAFTN